ncbi:hypothetical protein LCGC14_0779060 [marine sediment metagenome]|uniref:Uncharacterized protein n=1 Tax=marine sediment metagenome TaxID=412755 RepID=A0A0F9QFZ5_9ZZZZ
MHENLRYGAVSFALGFIVMLLGGQAVVALVEVWF